MFSLLRQRKELEIEIANLRQTIDHQKREQEMALKEKTAELTLKNTEMTALLKLDYQQKLKQLEIDNQRALDAAKVAAKNETMAVERTLSQDYFARTKDALEKLHTEGNITTQFLEKMALSLLGNVPEAKIRVSTKAIGNGE